MGRSMGPTMELTGAERVLALAPARVRVGMVGPGAGMALAAELCEKR